MFPRFSDPLIGEIRTTIPGRIPITPKELAIVPNTSRWKSIKDNNGITKLRKTYSLDELSQKIYFLNELSNHERETQHFIDYLVVFNDQTNKFDVTVDLYTRRLNSTTEADKEFAAYCDIVYYETCYNLKV
jgi:pterin-4a-carbinolamine dehydratase